VSPRRNLVGPEFDAWYENRLIRYPLRMVSCDHFTSSVLVSTFKPGGEFKVQTSCRYDPTIIIIDTVWRMYVIPKFAGFLDYKNTH